MRGIVIVLTLAIVAGLGGCAISQTKREARKIENRAATQAAGINAAGKVNDARGRNSPLLHPIDNANLEVRKIQHGSEILFWISLIVLAAAVGLKCYPPLAAIGKFLLPPSAALLGLSAACIFIAPFAPWIFFGALAVSLALGIAWAITHRSAIEADIGKVFTPANVTGAVTAVAAAAVAGVAGVAGAVKPPGATI